MGGRLDDIYLQPWYKCIGYWMDDWMMFTYNPDISVLDEGRVCRDLALVQSFVAPLCELDLQLPVVRLLVDDLQQDDDDDDVDDGNKDHLRKIR